jgi:hypothetical protein
VPASACLYTHSGNSTYKAFHHLSLDNTYSRSQFSITSLPTSKPPDTYDHHLLYSELPNHCIEYFLHKTLFCFVFNLSLARLWQLPRWRPSFFTQLSSYSIKNRQGSYKVISKAAKMVSTLEMFKSTDMQNLIKQEFLGAFNLTAVLLLNYKFSITITNSSRSYAWQQKNNRSHLLHSKNKRNIFCFCFWWYWSLHLLGRHSTTWATFPVRKVFLTLKIKIY